MSLVVCDVHEGRSGIPGYLTILGATVEIRPLKRGDYALGVQGLVERKTVTDLHRSVVQGRFWAQIGKIRVARRPYLVIEGPSLYAGPVPGESIRGICVAASDLGVTIVRSSTPRETASWLVEIAAGGAPIRDRPTFAQRPQSDDAPPGVVALSAAPGVSTKTARALVERYSTLAAISQATSDELQTIPGVGAKKTAAIRDLFHQPQGLTRSN